MIISSILGLNPSYLHGTIVSCRYDGLIISTNVIFSLKNPARNGKINLQERFFLFQEVITQVEQMAKSAYKPNHKKSSFHGTFVSVGH